MNLHPSVGDNPRGSTTSVPFAPEALYELKIDTNGNAVADIAYRVRFSSWDGASQAATLRRVAFAQLAAADDGGETVVTGARVSTGREAAVTEAGEYRFFAGWRSDPFFIDRRGLFCNNIQFTGDDLFVDKNVCSIVLEVPNTALVSKKLGLWHRTLVPADASGGGWAQIERGARPMQLLLVFAATGGKPASYLGAEPADDARFIAGFAHALEHSGGYSQEEAKRVAKTMLPEAMPFDPALPARFPDNGRALTDDAADVFLTILTNGRVTGDKVGPHRDLLSEFPYLGPTHDA
jgi:hypothetical protein